MVICAKTAEPIEMLFGLWTRMGPRKHVVGGMLTGATWRIPLNRPCTAAIRPFCQITFIIILYDIIIIIIVIIIMLLYFIILYYIVFI